MLLPAHFVEIMRWNICFDFCGSAKWPLLQSEDQQNPYLARSPYHSTGGPLAISEAPFHTPLSLAFLRAASSIGYPLRDTNGEPHTGFQFVQVICNMNSFH
jgi:hypothetical protein